MLYRVLLPALQIAMLFGAVGCQFHNHPVESGMEILPPPPSPPAPYTVSEMHLQTVRAMTFQYAALRTNFEEIAEPASRTIAAIGRASAAGRVRPTGPVVFIYHDPSEDPAEYFDVEIGVPVHEGVPPSAEFRVRALPAFHCATMIFRGPMKLLPKAYEKLVPEMIEAGLIPTEETRECCLVWEDPESSNNVVQIQVGFH